MVPPSSHRIPRVRRYSGFSPSSSVFAYGILTLSDMPSHTFRLAFSVLSTVLTPKVFLPLVWPRPRSLATTYGFSFDFSSSPYLDVSVQAVPSVYLCVQYTVTVYDHRRVAPFRHVRIADCLRLPAPFRSLPRLSSALSAKAFALRPFTLDLFPTVLHLPTRSLL